jgi:hypothetical protein
MSVMPNDGNFNDGFTIAEEYVSELVCEADEPVYTKLTGPE